MKIVKPSATLMWVTPDILKTIEEIARTCYKSEEKITDESAPKFVKTIMSRRHWHMLRHASMSYKLVCDRGVSHELVRHGLAAFAQESTRYCNYSKDSFGNEITVVQPPFSTIDAVIHWENAMEFEEREYLRLLRLGEPPQLARGVLGNSLKTEIVITTTIRHWYHIFTERLDKNAHPQMREVMSLVLNDAVNYVPVVFDRFLEAHKEDLLLSKYIQHASHGRREETGRILMHQSDLEYIYEKALELEEKCRG
jgi:thymidylate synthase (FAD)